MPNAKDISKQEHIHALLFGPSGAGKTHLLGEFLKAGSVWVLDSDIGIDTLAGKDVEYEQWYDRPGTPKPPKPAWDLIMEFIAEHQKNPTFTTYAFDGLTTMADTVAAWTIWKSGSSRSLLQLQDYQTIYGELTKFIIAIRKLKANVILTSHQEVIRDEFMKQKIQPLVIGDKFAPRLPLFWNNVWHLDVDPTEGGEPKRRLMVQSDGKHVAKSLGKSNEVCIVEPTYEKIVAHLTDSPPKIERSTKEKK